MRLKNDESTPKTLSENESWKRIKKLLFRWSFVKIETNCLLIIFLGYFWFYLYNLITLNFEIQVEFKEKQKAIFGKSCSFVFGWI